MIYANALLSTKGEGDHSREEARGLTPILSNRLAMKGVSTLDQYLSKAFGCCLLLISIPPPDFKFGHHPPHLFTTTTEECLRIRGLLLCLTWCGGRYIMISSLKGQSLKEMRFWKVTHSPSSVCCFSLSSSSFFVWLRWMSSTASSLEKHIVGQVSYMLVDIITICSMKYGLSSSTRELRMVVAIGERRLWRFV